ncbi:MAG: hypothetical protein KatS3mg023_3224 [Armatimonadota bacterium]|nr:MAG: hypothetical protein KatS3mg023_3224 [Armatimonadota bacterium]
MTCLADAAGEREHLLEVIPRQPVHVHLRAQEGVYALYGTPLSLRLCVDILQEHLQGRYLLLLRTVQMQWFEERGLPVHSVPPSFLLIPVQHAHHLAQQAFPHLAFADTPLSPEDLEALHVERLVVDTFTSPLWHLVVDPAISNVLYGEIRNECCTHLLSKERSLLTGVLSRFLRAYTRYHLPDIAPLEDFPPLIHEQLWQYATQGLAPQGVERTPKVVEIKVALGTPDPGACVTTPACPHVSQIQRGFVLRWQDSGWDLCSTEECATWQR